MGSKWKTVLLLRSLFTLSDVEGELVPGYTLRVGRKPAMGYTYA